MTNFAQKIRDDSDDMRYYGIEPQVTAGAVTLELRTRDGKIKGCDYSYVPDKDYDPEIGITIYASDKTIIIKRRGLLEVYRYLVSGRLTYVQEDFSGIDDEESSVFLESITITSK